MNELLRSLHRFWPEVVLTVGLLLVVLIDTIRARGRDVANWLLTMATLAAAFVLSVRLGAQSGGLFEGMLALDPIGIFFKLILIGSSLLVVGDFRFDGSRELRGLGQGEFYALMLAVTLSNLLMAAANDLAMLYLSLEMVSITSYVMVAYLKGDRLSNEASLKYILFGAVSTGAMLYGFSLLYGMTGTTSLPQIQEFLAGDLSTQSRKAVYLTTFLITAGFGFKV